MNILGYLLIITAYLLGSISSAIIFCQLAGLPDPRQCGSKNAGATNVLRIGGKLSAIGVLLFDVLKGILPTAIGLYFKLPPSMIGIIALASCLGHIFPVFFRFRGGKGVATAFGALIALGTALPLFAFGTWVVVFLLSGYSSLSAVITALALPFYAWWICPQFTFPVALVCCLLIYRHHENIQRLWRGQEDKVWDQLRKS